MVGHGYGGHVEFFDTLDQALDVAGAVQHGIVGVEMKMYELRLGHSELDPSLCSFYFMRRRHSLYARQAVENGHEMQFIPGYTDQRSSSS
jgi:hypothetical protein